MNTPYSAHRVALASGLFVGLVHVAWSVLVALGLAQALIDFIFELHMVVPPVTVMPFSFGTAIGLVIVTFCVGYVAGFVATSVWNAMQKKA